MSTKKIFRLGVRVSNFDQCSPITKSPECIVPSAFDTLHRQQSAKVGVFNLISTMIGGGVLSLPFAVSQSGLILGFLLLTLSAITSIFSFDILVSASRRTGAATYQQIGYFAFGENISVFISLLIWILTYLASTGYCILVGDLLKPILCYICNLSDTDCSSEWLRRIVILCGILCVSPFCYMRQIKALKYTSLIGLVGVTLLAFIITLTTAQSFGQVHDIYYIDGSGQSMMYQMSNDIKLFPTSFDDVIYVFPVFGIAFMCHFNIPQVHSELTRPTRLRMRWILICVALACYIIYTFIAFFGYFYSFGYTCGNILLNYDQRSFIVSLARLCLGAVVLFSFPLLILPARSNLHNLLNAVFSFKSMNIEDSHMDDDDDDDTRTSDGGSVSMISIDTSSGDDFKNVTRSLTSKQMIKYDTFTTKTTPMAAANKYSKSTSNLMATQQLQRFMSFKSRSFSNLDSPLRTCADALGVMNSPADVERLRNEDFVKEFSGIDNAKDFTPTKIWLVAETTVMIALPLIVSFLTSSVMVLWALVGSTVTFVIAFMLPSMFYIKIRRHKGFTLRNICAMIIAVISCVAMVLCSWQAVLRLDVLPCPIQPQMQSNLR